MSDEPRKPQLEQAFIAASMGEVVKQTIYRKYEASMEIQKQLYFQALRSRTGKMNPNTTALFKAAVLDLLFELTPKFKSYPDYAKYAELSDAFLQGKQDVSVYFAVLTICGGFLDFIGVTKIFTQKQSGAAAGAGRTN